MNEHLTDPVHVELHDLLKQRRSEVQARLRAVRAAQGAEELHEALQLAGAERDREDQAADLAEWDREHINEMDLQARLAEIEHALAKFAAGRYGVCEQCSRPIPLARLLLVPEARYDLEHEAALETRTGIARVSERAAQSEA